MKRELQEQIFKECPLLYGDRTKPMTQTCMCWGIDVAELTKPHHMIYLRNGNYRFSKKLSKLS